MALGADGAVRVVVLEEGDEDEDEMGAGSGAALELKPIWDAEMERREREGPEEGMPEDGVDKRETARTMYDMRWAWEGESSDSRGQHCGGQCVLMLNAQR
jgi:hypothetical protein